MYVSFHLVEPESGIIPSGQKKSFNRQFYRQI